MKKLLCIVFSLLLVGSLCACSLAGDSSSPTSNAGNSVTPSEDTQTKNTDVVLVDNETIKATFVGAKDESPLGVFYVTLKIENKTATDIVINLEDADVDGETIPLITTGVPLVVRPGNSGQTAFIFSMVNLSISSMDDATNATFRIVARDNNSFDSICESDLVMVDLH